MPEWRVLLQAEPEGVVCHVGVQRREVKWNGRKMRAGGIGGVLTREGFRRRGYASLALNAAIQILKDEGSIDFALLFCEPHNVAFYVGRGWKPFEGEIFCEQPEGRIRFDAIGALRLRAQARPAAGHHRPMRAAVVSPAAAGFSRVGQMIARQG